MDSGGWPGQVQVRPTEVALHPGPLLRWGSTVSPRSASAEPPLVFGGCQRFHAVLLFHVDYITASLTALSLSLCLRHTHEHTPAHKVNL